ncbi:DUF982 domain-containing protein, partial [Shinella sp.]|uniref:DUF982 domain-containing protein n=1 Tax=Shinella sp. TaxID=1870904 RepID=UPI002897560D
MVANWANTITVEVNDKPGTFSRISDTRNAAHYLLDRWTKERTPSYCAAVRMCAKAIKGEASHEGAYISFMTAVREAKLSSVSCRMRDELDELDELDEDISQALAESILFELRSEWQTV